MMATALFPLWPAWVFITSPPQTKAKLTPRLAPCLFDTGMAGMSPVETQAQVPVPVQRVLSPTKPSLQPRYAFLDMPKKIPQVQGQHLSCRIKKKRKQEDNEGLLRSVSLTALE